MMSFINDDLGGLETVKMEEERTKQSAEWNLVTKQTEAEQEARGRKLSKKN